MKLSTLKVCESRVIRKYIGDSKANVAYRENKLNEVEAEIDTDIRKYGDADVGVMLSAGRCMSYLTCACAERAADEFNDTYPTDEEKMAAIGRFARGSS